jgi:prefoldin subunit 5
MEKVITQEELYKKEMREMQREINYLRKRVAELTDELYEFKKHTSAAISYLDDQASDI